MSKDIMILTSPGSLTPDQSCELDGSRSVVLFKSPEFGPIRTFVDEEGAPYFCAVDVCRALGYGNSREALRKHVDEDDVTKRDATDSLGRKQFSSFINESGLYSLILSSKLPQAREFKRWVTSVVLPQIRKTGGYIPIGNENRASSESGDGLAQSLPSREGGKDAQRLNENENENWAGALSAASSESGDGLAQSLPSREGGKDAQRLNENWAGDLSAASDLEIMARALLIVQRTLELRNHRIAGLEQSVALLAPKAEYCDEVLDSVDCMTTTQVAKGLGMTAQELNLWLCNRGIQYGQSGQYLLYADYARRGLAKNRTHSYRDDEGVHTHSYLVWTERGRAFITRMVKEASRT